MVQIGVQERAATDSKQSLEQSHSERMAELEAELTQLQEKLEAAELGFKDTSRKLDDASQTHDEAVSQLNAHVTCPSPPIILSALLPPSPQFLCLSMSFPCFIKTAMSTISKNA